MKRNNTQIQKKDSPVEIYAEISKKQFQLIASGDYDIEVPSGVSMTHKAGSRILTFFCDGAESAQLLMEGLDESYVNWQEM